MHLRGEDDRNVVAVLGDGALTGGMAYEGLNNLGHSGRKAIIILNDNGRSYAPTVSRLGESLSRFRASSTYLRNRARIEKLIQDVPLVGGYLERGVDGAKAAIREMFEPPAFFEQLGVHYLGPYDGHDIIAAGAGAARRPKDLDEPVVVHVLTQKGRGYGPAENDDDQAHARRGRREGGLATRRPSPTRSSRRARPGPSWSPSPRPCPTPPACCPSASASRTASFDVGIAEQHAVTSAAGMAMGGLRPVVAVYSTFLTRAIDQVNLDVGLHAQPVVFVPGPGRHHRRRRALAPRRARHGAPVQGAGHDGVRPVQLRRRSARMLHDALELCTDGPAAIRFPKTMPPPTDDPEIGTLTGSGLSARKVREGREICLIGVGKMLAAACRGRRAAWPREGHEATVWDPRVVKPLDPEMLADAAGHRLVITIEDGLRDGGIGSADGGRAVQAGAGQRARRSGCWASRRCTCPRASPTPSWPSWAWTPTASRTRPWPGSAPPPTSPADASRPTGPRVSRRGSRPPSGRWRR